MLSVERAIVTRKDWIQSFQYFFSFPDIGEVLSQN